ncbi:hypothetical protein DL766_005295 [Monosporascus sp. MC13-8B]|uniref:Cell wall mannoprotein PIR1-like C-terminal domain-containing protein n=1 Tax=Monosporascus cannonballus TaxID=155416 RepID=A0ABY0GVX2_9PEZI|nr:hypothetical protein DL762_010033 [Monosporascus cannonballus]RYO76782.1 hypothetical protein DL763_010169 [Monosporascus cannonballus]RYP29562.1 hypothetical protein DL766_005295 [Monosporascus sp. MC13-8B]
MMRFTFAVASALLGIALAAPQGVTDVVTPTGSAPAGCTGSFEGSFEITVTQPKVKRGMNLERRAECGRNGVLVLTLAEGSVFDAQDRTGYIASNFQFQFDGPPQAGAIFTGGFSLCENNILALGDSTTFYQCLSGDFYNLYDRDWAEQCEPVSIVAIPCGKLGAVVSDIGDGQIVATSIVETTVITALSDGQPQVITTSVDIPLCQIGDGQVQIQTTPCASITAYPTPSYVPVSESSDGQVINPTPPTALPPAPTTSAPPPPETTPELPSETPTEVPSVEQPPTTEQPPVTSETTSVPVPSSSTEVETPSSEVPSPPSATPPVETSAPPVSGSSRAAAGSLAALILGVMFAYVCL